MPSTPRSRPASRCRWWSPISTGPAATCRSCSTARRTIASTSSAARAWRRRPRPSRPIAQLGLDLVPGTGLLAAVVPGAFDAWMLMLRDHGTMELSEVLAPALGYATGGFAVVPNISKTIETVRDLFETEWPSSAAIWLGTADRSPASCSDNPAVAETYQRLLRETKSAGRSREARIEAARRAWYGGLRRRGDRPVLPHAGGDGQLGPPASRPAHRRRHGALVGHGRAALQLRLSRLHPVQDRPLGPGAGGAAAAGAAQGLRSRRPVGRGSGFRPHRRGVREARLRGSRGVLRRSRFRARADGDPAVRRLQRRAPQAGRASAPRASCGPDTSPATARRRSCASPAAPTSMSPMPARTARASRRSPASRR